MSSLHITAKTSLTDLQIFLRDNDGALHGKLHEDGTCTLYVRKGNGSHANYLFKSFSKEDRQAHARVAILKVLHNHNNNTEMQDLFAEHFMENEAQFHAKAEIAAKRNPELPIFIDKEDPSDRVKMLENYLSAPLPRHIKTAILPAASLDQGKTINTQKPRRIEPAKHRQTLYAKDIMRILAPETAPIAPQKISTDPDRDFTNIGLRFDENNKPKTFFDDMAMYFQENIDSENSVHTGIDQRDNFSKALSPTLWATSIFPTSFRKGDGQKFAIAVQKFIEDSKLDCPFKIDKAGEEILAAGVTILRKLPMAAAAFVEGSLKNPDNVRDAAGDLKGMIRDLRGVRLGAELFTNQDFLETVPPPQREAIFQLGKNFQNLFIQLVDPAGPYQAIYKLKSLAIESPQEFSASLKQYQTESNKANHGRSSQALIE